jgi:hypothetical protein
MTGDSCSTIEAIEPSFYFFYVIMFLCSSRAFLPALLGACRHADHGIKLPPVTVLTAQAVICDVRDDFVNRVTTQAPLNLRVA